MKKSVNSREFSAVKSIFEGTATATGKEFFNLFVKNLAIALGTSTAWITEFGKDRKTLRTLSFYHDGNWLENMEYEMKGTPCETVIKNKSLVHIPRDIFELYPDDPTLEPMNAVSYMGMPYLDENGEVIGHIAVMDSKYMPDEETSLYIFRIFVSRASAEFQRLKAESRIKETNEKLSRLFNSAMDGIIEVDALLRINQVNPSAEKLFNSTIEELVSDSINNYLDSESRGKLIYLIKGLDDRPEGKRQIWVPGGLNIHNKAGNEFVAEVTISVSDAGSNNYYTLILRNINDRIEAEKKIQSLRLETEYLQSEINTMHNFDEIIGNSKSLKDVFINIERVAGTDTTVLILGETGTGKELIARAIHKSSNRSNKPLIKVNCAAIPASLIESEFFGHEQGAFTGATKKRTGRFSLADGGTIFLDEIGELPIELQSKLLRVLQEGEFEPVGSSKTIKVDVRIIAATNRNLEDELEKGKFRQDLFFRLNVFPITIPPLRERDKDIILIAEYFLNKASKNIGKTIKPLTDDMKDSLMKYDWPGNIRELQNVIERAVITSVDGSLNLDALSTVQNLTGMYDRKFNSATSDSRDNKILTDEDIRNIEKGNILKALEQCNWRISGKKGAANLLGIPSTTLNSRIKSFNIKKQID